MAPLVRFLALFMTVRHLLSLDATIRAPAHLLANNRWARLSTEIRTKPTASIDIYMLPGVGFIYNLFPPMVVVQTQTYGFTINTHRRG